MAQTVSIKLDNVLSTPAAEASKSPSTPENQAFNAEFDRQIKRDNSSAEPSTQAKKNAPVTDTATPHDADKAEKTEVTDVSDGNNLPLANKSQPTSEKETQPEQVAATAENAVPPELLAMPEIEPESTPTSEVKDEAAIEQWLAALQIEMERAGVPLTAAEVELLKQTVTPTMLNAPPALILQTDKAVRSSALAKLMPQPMADKLSVNAELPLQNTKTTLPLTIRADILQAITKNAVQTSSDNQKTLKNVMHAMTQNADAKISPAAVTDIVRQIQAGSSGQERPVTMPLFSGFTPVSSASASSSAPIALDVQPGLNQPNWSRVVSSRVIYMAREGVQHAELRLNPAQLGPVEVRLSVVNEQTTVTFLANNAATREALEQALPRLRESFAESGLALNNAEVGQQDQSQNPQQDEQFTAQDSRIIQVSTELDDIEDVTPPLQGDQQELGGGVSLYA